MTTLYENDFAAWLDFQKECIRNKKFENLDVVNLLEEMNDMGKSYKDAIESHLDNLILHMLKSIYQPDMLCNSWNASITNARNCISRITRKNPSLKKYPSEVLDACYQEAIKGASKETGIPLNVFPKECPWALNQILGE